MAEKYRGALSTAMLLNDSEDVRDFMHYLIDGVEELGLKDGDIPPIVFNEMGKVFNIDYNFLVSRLSDWMNDSLILDDFRLDEKVHQQIYKNGYFLIVCLLEVMHELVRVRQTKLDLTRYRSLKSFNITDKFYNVLLMKNGENIRRFNAIPFSKSEVKKLISEEYFGKLNAISSSEKFQQIAFGHGKYLEFCKEHGIEPDPVFE